MPEGILNLSTFLGLSLGLLLGFGLAALAFLKKSKSLTLQPTPLTETGHLLADSEAQAVPSPAPSPAPKHEPAGPQAGDGIVLGLLGLRGGSGKSILAVALAEAWARNGKRVLLIETDPNGGLGQRLGRSLEPGKQTGDIRDLPTGFGHCQLPSHNPQAWLREQRQAWDYLLIDAYLPQGADAQALLPLLDAAVLVSPLVAQAMLSLGGAQTLLQEGMNLPHQRFLGVQFTRFVASDPLQSALWQRLNGDYPQLSLATPCPEDENMVRWSAGLCDWPIPDWQWLPARSLDARLAEAAIQLKT